MSYTLNETKYNSPNYTPASQVAATYGMARTITGVTIHHWGVDGQSIDGISSYLCRPGGNTSAHFSLQDGLVYCLVSPEDAAWHAGSAEGNATTIGIECRPEMTDGDLRTLVEFIQWLESVYGSLDIYRHQDWSSTECPGRYAGQIDWIVDQVNAGSTPSLPSTGGGGSIEAAIGWFTDRAGAVTYSMDYRNGPGSYDCSSSIYYALAAAGINTSGKVGNTETMFSDLPAWGFQEVAATAAGIPTQRGDIFIWGDPGSSSGAAGHTGIFADADNIWHCNYGYNGITLNNHDYIWSANGSPPCHIFRYYGGGSSPVYKQTVSKDWFDMASRQDLAEVVNDVIHANEGFFRQLTHKVLFDEKFDRQGTVNGKPLGGTTTFALETMYAAQNFGRLKADVLWAQKQNEGLKADVLFAQRQVAELTAEVKALKEGK